MKLMKAVSITLSGYLNSKEPPLFSVVLAADHPPKPLFCSASQLL